MWFGNWYRPLPTLAQQVSLGFQFVIGHEPGGTADGKPVSREDYKAACRTLRLGYFMQMPADDAMLKAEAADPFCLGWDQSDEPNDKKPNDPTAAALVAKYKWARAVARPDQLVILNYDGWQDPLWNDFDYATATPGACDIVMWDYYFRNHDGPSTSLATSIVAGTAKLAARYRKWMRPDQKLGFFLETDDQDLRKQAWANTPDANGVKPATYMCGPTIADVQEYFDAAVANKIDIICAFEDVIGTWFESYSSTSAAMYGVISQNIAKLKTPIAPPKPPAPFDGVEVQTGGYTYVLKAK